MVRVAIRRALTVGAVLATLAAPLTLTTAPAAAAPVGSIRVTAATPTVNLATTAERRAPATPNGVTITGAGLDIPIDVRAADKPALVDSLRQQVSWLETTAPQTTAPAESERGPQYTVVLLVDAKPVATYDLYPLAKGGPRAFRPGAQPDRRKVEAGWYFGRLTMSETLRTAGAPLPEIPDVISGGIGGGERVNPQEMTDPRDDINRLLAQLRQVLLLNAGVLLVITLGLAGMSLLIRRRV